MIFLSLFSCLVSFLSHPSLLFCPQVGIAFPEGSFGRALESERSALKLLSCSLPRAPLLLSRALICTLQACRCRRGGSDPAPLPEVGVGWAGAEALRGCPWDSSEQGRCRHLFIERGSWGLHGRFNRRLKHLGVCTYHGGWVGRGPCSVRCSSSAFSWFSSGHARFN